MVAVTDYMKSLPEMIARWVPGGLTPLGTDGFGRSDTREALRRFFETDAEHVAAAVLADLARRKTIPATAAAKGIAALGVETEVHDPSMG